jgi:hypothetical protein
VSRICVLRFVVMSMMLYSVIYCKRIIYYAILPYNHFIYRQKVHKKVPRSVKYINKK